MMFMKRTKCANVKNPCRICLQSVTNKTGVQCKGACRKWAHFKCLNYTPGKIVDIKSGFITINCPCPNCNIAPDEKESFANPSYQCNNEQCPASKQPKCQIEDCPLNMVSRGIQPSYQATPSQVRGMTKCLANRKCVGVSPEVSPKYSDSASIVICPEPQKRPAKESGLLESASPRGLKTPSRDPCETICSPVPLPGDYMPPSVSAGNLWYETPPSETSQKVFKHAKSASCVCVTHGTETFPELVELEDQKGDFKMTRSDSKLMKSRADKETEKALLCTIHELCSTVGTLSNRIKDLMCRMITSMEKNGRF